MAAAARGNKGLAGQRVLEKQLEICGYKKNTDVKELYLGEKGLKEIPDLSRFRILSYLWLNDNKIEKLTFLKNNCCLRELYLNNNEIRNIAGALRHIHSLQTLLLHNNQLKNLDVTVKELKGMKSLQTLSNIRQIMYTFHRKVIFEEAVWSPIIQSFFEGSFAEQIDFLIKHTSISFN